MFFCLFFFFHKTCLLNVETCHHDIPNGRRCRRICFFSAINSEESYLMMMKVIERISHLLLQRLHQSLMNRDLVDFKRWNRLSGMCLQMGFLNFYLKYWYDWQILDDILLVEVEVKILNGKAKLQVDKKAGKHTVGKFS